MPGFGYGPFGHGPFGAFDWAKQVLFRDLPALDREIDVTEGGGRLERFMDSIKPSFDELLRFTRSFFGKPRVSRTDLPAAPHTDPSN